MALEIIKLRGIFAVSFRLFREVTGPLNSGGMLRILVRNIGHQNLKVEKSVARQFSRGRTFYWSIQLGLPYPVSFVSIILIVLPSPLARGGGCWLRWFVNTNESR